MKEQVYGRVNLHLINGYCKTAILLNKVFMRCNRKDGT